MARRHLGAGKPATCRAKTMQAHASRGSFASVGFIDTAHRSGLPDSVRRAGASGTIKLGEHRQFHDFKEVSHGPQSPQTLG